MKTTHILTDYINRETSRYKEPSRKGTPKGEKVGLSRRKHEASLWLLSNIWIKDCAENLAIPYGVLRVWRTKKDFKDAIQQNIQGFLKYAADIPMETIYREAEEIFSDELWKEWINATTVSR